jgi:hypothetical protein
VGLNLLPDPFALRLCQRTLLIWVLGGHKFLLESFLRLNLLGHTGFGSTDLLVDLLLLREAPDLEVATFAAREQMLGHPLEQRVVCQCLVGLDPDVLRRCRQVILVEDFIGAIRDRCYGEHQPRFIGKVLLRHVDAGLNVVLLEIGHQLLNQDQLAWGLHAKPEDHLLLAQGEDLVLLDGVQLLLRDKLARKVWQVLAMPCQQLPESPDILERGQFGCGGSVNHSNNTIDTRNLDLNNRQQH